MITAVDTNVILDILIPDSPFGSVSKRLLEAAFQGGRLIICEAVYAELAAQFRNQTALDVFLNDTRIRLVSSTSEALNLAGLKWFEYNRRRAQNQRCPACGCSVEYTCSKCGTRQTTRQHVLADFLIGAHGLLQANKLLTRDRGYYRTYFPELDIAGS